MNNKSVKVNCSFCGKEIECPEEMLKEVERHACSECFEKGEELFAGISEEEMGKIHVDYPMEELSSKMAEDLADKLVEQEFLEIWSDLKDDLKENSKKELAEKMFWQGACMAAGTVLETLRKKAGEAEDGEKEDEEEMNDNDSDEAETEEDDLDTDEEGDEGMPVGG